MDDTRRMTSLEAIQQLIAVADAHMSLSRSMAELGEMTPQQRETIENIEVAISTVQAVLNTAMPVARFRCFVSVEVGKKPKGPIRDDYTICAPTIEGITAGLIGLAQTRVDVHATLWEQRAMGAEMLSGYQGPTKVGRYRSWVESLIAIFHEEPNVEAPKNDNADTRAEEAGSQDQAGTAEGEQRSSGPDDEFYDCADEDA